MRIELLRGLQYVILLKPILFDMVTTVSLDRLKPTASSTKGMGGIKHLPSPLCETIRRWH